MMVQYSRITSKDNYCKYYCWREVNDEGWKLWLRMCNLEQGSAERTLKWPVNMA